ncbi:MAG: hypothetical protein M3535_03605, partial [Actinomycetota bacterium]|nr:hypothetical protein [Actinomycetota bacterium]
MATATRQRPPAKKKRPTARQGKKAPTAAARAKASRERSQRRQARIHALGRGLSRGDVWGAVLVVVGVLVALGIWADVGGSLGRGVDDALTGLVGVARVVLPLAMVWLG